MRLADAIQILTAVGFGTGTAAIIVAIITARSGKGKSRAEAADLMLSAAERVGRLNQDQAGRIDDLTVKLDRVNLLMLKYLSGDISREELLDELASSTLNYVRKPNDNT